MKDKKITNLLEVIVITVAIIVGMLLFLIVKSFAYEIKDTVHVEDSITVTMSMEEWNQVEAMFTIDWEALSDDVWPCYHPIPKPVSGHTIDWDTVSEEFWESLTLPPPRGIPGIPPHRIAKEVKR